VSLVPRSLLARTVLTIAVLLLASQAAWFELWRAYEREPRARQVAQRAVAVVTLTRAALLAAHPDRRRGLLEELSRTQGIRVYPIEADELIPPIPDDPLFRRVADEIRVALGESTEVAFDQDDVEALWVSFDVGEDGYWVVMPRLKSDDALPWQWLGWGGVVALLSLLGAWALVARINRPLTEVAGAASLIGRGETAPPVAERGPAETRALARAVNQMAHDLAEQDRDRALLLAGVSHDLRTPLARLRLGIELNCRDDAEREAMAADLDSMDRTIGQFLDFARPDRAQAAPTDVNAVATKLVQQLAARGIRVETALEPLPPAPIRAEALRRAILNLLENAAAYAGGEIVLRTARAGDSVEIAVLDRGPGIPDADLEAVKRPFHRLDAARANAGGAGLGLAIAERIARLHGGSLSLANREGGGLEARLTIPLRP
jgi:two-component system osmolarity sensor histidine kinase EnvZ